MDLKSNLGELVRKEGRDRGQKRKRRWGERRGGRGEERKGETLFQSNVRQKTIYLEGSENTEHD